MPESDRNPKDYFEPVFENFFLLTADVQSIWGQKINDALKNQGLAERFIQISDEGKVIAEGIWTPQEARDIANRVKYVAEPPKGKNNYIADLRDFYKEEDGRIFSEGFRTNSKAVLAIMRAGIIGMKLGLRLSHFPSGIPGKETVILSWP